MAGGRMPLWWHLEELRWVLLKSLLAVAAATAACLTFMHPLLRLFMAPIAGLEDKVELVFSSPAEAFFAQLKLALLGGAVSAVPLVLCFAWGFVAPGLHENERTAVRRCAMVGGVLFLAGTVFGFYILRYAIAFLVGLAPPGFRQLWPLDAYIGFCGQFVLGFGVVFELPVVIFLLVRLEVVSLEALRRGRPYAVVAILVVSALLTPPDPFTMLVMAVPLLILYEIGVFFGALGLRCAKN